MENRENSIKTKVSQKCDGWVLTEAGLREPYGRCSQVMHEPEDKEKMCKMLPSVHDTIIANMLS